MVGELELSLKQHTHTSTHTHVHTNEKQQPFAPIEVPCLPHELLFRSFLQPFSVCLWLFTLHFGNSGIFLLLRFAIFLQSFVLAFAEAALKFRLMAIQVNTDSRAELSCI